MNHSQPSIFHRTIHAKPSNVHRTHHAKACNTHGMNHSTGCKILVVDDVDANLLAIESVLADIDAELLLANSGEAALELLMRETEVPALALIDVQMPGIDGYELARLIRGNVRLQHVPIIFLSAIFRDATHIFTGYESGAVDYITKPFSSAVLQAKAKIFLDLHHYRRAAVQAEISKREAVAKSEERLNAVMQITREAIWDWHIPSGHMVHNLQWYETLGLQPSAIQDTVDAFVALIYPDDKPEVMQRMDALLRGETDSYQSEHRMLGKHGMVWVQDRGGVVERDEQGHPLRVVGSFTDITERHINQDRITALLGEQQTLLQRYYESSRLVRNVIDNIADPVFLKDEQGKFVLVNMALARMYNTTPSAMIGLRASDLGVSVTLADGFFQGERAALLNGETLVVFEDMQDSVSGKIRHYKSTKTPMTDSHGQQQVLVLVQDVTEIIHSHQQVVESERRLQNVLNVTREAVWDWHIPSGHVAHNPQWYEVLGFQASDIADTLDAFAALIHPDDKPGVMQRVDALLHGQTDSYQSEHRMVGKHDTLWVQDRGGVVERDEQGHPVRVVGSFSDITERRVAQDRITALLSEQQAMLQSDVVSLLLTQNNLIFWATPSLLHALGYDWQKLKGRDIRFIFQSEETFGVFSEAAYPVIRAHQVFRTPVQFRHQNGSLCWFDLAGAMFGEHSDQVLWSCIDISAQKMAEEKLIAAQQEALAATVAKSQFLAMMSHEVRTPMNGVLGMAQLLVKPELSDDKRVQYAQTILRSGHSLLTLLNDILDLSKVEAGKLKLESIAFAVDSVVGDIRSLFATVAGAQGLQFQSVWEGPTDTRYLGDPYRLRQMLSNLINNAIKFTDHGFVSMVVREIERHSQHAVLEFSVSDSGIGITHEQQARLFKPFSQADSSTTRQFGGTGLGLSIVARLAQLMEGEVGIESEPGQGARFWFRVRVGIQAQESSETTVTSEAVPAGNLTGTVLIAEDNAVNRMVITAMLDELNYSGVTVTMAEDGQQALDYITRGGAPDLVLMDVHMPIMDGLAATQHIRLWQADHGKSPVTIVALTASAFEEDRQKCQDSGMDDFLVKPLDIQKLQTTLGRWLKVSV